MTVDLAFPCFSRRSEFNRCMDLLKAAQLNPRDESFCQDACPVIRLSLNEYVAEVWFSDTNDADTLVIYDDFDLMIIKFELSGAVNSIISTLEHLHAMR